MPGHDPAHSVRLDLVTRRQTTLATSEPLRAPFDIDIAPDHALLVQDQGRVVRISPSNGSLTVLGDGQATGADASPFADFAMQIASDPRGGVFVARGNRIEHLASDGTRRDVVGAASGFTNIADMIADRDGHLFVATTHEFAAGQRIRRVDAATGAVTTVVGPGTAVLDAAGKPTARVASPDRLAWDRHGRLMFTDATRILRFDPQDGQVRVVSGRRATVGGWAGLAVAADGDLIVADYAANRVRRIDARSGQMTTLAGRGRPTPITLDGESTYDPPGDEVCSNDPGDAVLDVKVQDAQGAALPGAAVRLFSAGLNATKDSTGREIWVLANEEGVARVRLAASGDYVVLASLAGFLPASSAVRLSTSCTARIHLSLAVAPIR
jgi:streptogramin lyase